MATPISITLLQYLPLSIAPTDRRHNPAPVTNIQWGSSGSSFQIVPSLDGLSCEITPTELTMETVSVSAVAEDGVTLTETIDVSVVAAPAVVLNLVPGNPVDLP